MKCTVCDTADGSEMTDGKVTIVLCDACRPLTVTLFHVYYSLTVAANEARQALTGRKS